VEEKHVYAKGFGVNNSRGRRYKGKEGHQENIAARSQAHERKVNSNFGKIAERFCIVLQMN